MLTIDHTAFDPARITPETAEFNRWLEETLEAAPKTHDVPPEVSRQAREEGKGIFPPAGPLEGSEYREIDGGKLRISLPEGEVKGVFIHIHGGGWTLGAPHLADEWCQYLAREAGAAVVSLPYRLAPEHAWPAQGDDVERGALLALDLAKSEFGDAPVVIGGESAGAHLAAVALLRLRARGMIARISGALMHYGFFAPGLTPSARNWGRRQMVLSTPTLDWFTANLGEVDLTDPDVTPLNADLSEMPRALFQCGTMDPLIDDTLFMASRWAAAGRGAEVKLYPGGVHAFDMFPLAIASEARETAAKFLKESFAAA